MADVDCWGGGVLLLRLEVEERFVRLGDKDFILGVLNLADCKFNGAGLLLVIEPFRDIFHGGWMA